MTMRYRLVVLVLLLIYCGKFAAAQNAAGALRRDHPQCSLRFLHRLNDPDDRDSYPRLHRQPSIRDQPQ